MFHHNSEKECVDKIIECYLVNFFLMRNQNILDLFLEPFFFLKIRENICKISVVEAIFLNDCFFFAEKTENN